VLCFSARTIALRATTRHDRRWLAPATGLHAMGRTGPADGSEELLAPIYGWFVRDSKRPI
jgi:hypothetical protein